MHTSRSPSHPPGVEHESQVDRTLAPHIKASLLSVRDWRGYRNPWMPEGGAVLYYWACFGGFGGVMIEHGAARNPLMPEGGAGYIFLGVLWRFWRAGEWAWGRYRNPLMPQEVRAPGKGGSG